MSVQKIAGLRCILLHCPDKRLCIPRERAKMVKRYRKLRHLPVGSKLNKANPAWMTGISATTISVMSADKEVSHRSLLRTISVLCCNHFGIIGTAGGDVPVAQID